MIYTLSFILDIAIHGGIFAAFVTAASYFFMMTQYENKPRRLFLLTATLMTLIAAQSLEYLVLALTGSNSNIISDVGLSIIVNLLVIPFCYLMLMELTLYREVTLRLAIPHIAIPSALAITHYILLFIRPQSCVLVLAAYLSWMAFAITRFAIPAIRHIKLYNERIRDYYADVEGRDINWVGRVLSTFLVIALLFIILKVILDNEASRFIYSFIALWFWMTIAWNVSRMRHNEAALADDDTVDYNTIAHLTDNESSIFLRQFHDTLLNDKLYAQSDLTRDMMAKQMGTNYRFLIQNLKAATGMTFSAYVTRVRMEEAARMLITTDKTVSEVLYACGFESSSTFYRAFTRTYNCSPVEYRKRYNSQK